MNLRRLDLALAHRQDENPGIESRPTQRAATVLFVKAVAVFYSVGKGTN